MSGSYEVLTALANESGDLGTADRRQYLWHNLPRLADALRDTLTCLGEPVYLEDVTIYVEDPSYKQGAAALLLDFRFEGGDPFRIRASCLVDHASITLRVISAPVSPRFDRIRAVLEEPSPAAEGLALHQLAGSQGIVA